MARFTKHKSMISYRNILLSLFLFSLVLGLFHAAITSFSQKSEQEQLRNLEHTLTQSVVHCYAMEGSYPESLEDLKENYGIVYDSSKFFVDYRAQGQNMMPDITVLLKNTLSDRQDKKR